LIIALNKIDTLDQSKLTTILDTKINLLKQAFGNTKFGKDVHVQPVAADPSKFYFCKNSKENENTEIKINYDDFLNALIVKIIETVDFNKRIKSDKKILYSIDHCFNIKNKGTIVTGTVLQGTVSVKDEIYFPEICEKKVVKEMQMFKKNITKAFQGDRIGMLIKNLDHTKLERSIACKEGYVNSFEGGIFMVLFTIKNIS